MHQKLLLLITLVLTTSLETRASTSKKPQTLQYHAQVTFQNDAIKRAWVVMPHLRVLLLDKKAVYFKRATTSFGHLATYQAFVPVDKISSEDSAQVHLAIKLAKQRAQFEHRYKDQHTQWHITQKGVITQKKQAVSLTQKK